MYLNVGVYSRVRPASSPSQHHCSLQSEVRALTIPDGKRCAISRTSGPSHLLSQIIILANILELGLVSEVLVWFCFETKDKENLSVWGSGLAVPQASCGKHVTILIFIKIKCNCSQIWFFGG